MLHKLLRRLFIGNIAMVLGLTAWMGSVAADDSDDSLRLLLAKSDLVAAAKILAEPEIVSTGEGVVNYIVQLELKSVIQGDSLATDNLTVNVVRFQQSEEERPSFLKKGQDCVFFLRKVGPKDHHAWMTADCWFGFQPLSPTLYRSLSRLAK